MNQPDAAWLEYWEHTRSRGKSRYVLTRGLIFGITLPVAMMLGSQLSGKPDGATALVTAGLLAFGTWTALSLWDWGRNERRYLEQARHVASPPAENA